MLRLTPPCSTTPTGTDLVPTGLEPTGTLDIPTPPTTMLLWPLDTPTSAPPPPSTLLVSLTLLSPPWLEVTLLLAAMLPTLLESSTSPRGRLRPRPMLRLTPLCSTLTTATVSQLTLDTALTDWLATLTPTVPTLTTTDWDTLTTLPLLSPPLLLPLLLLLLLPSPLDTP